MMDENPYVRRKQALEELRKELGLSCAVSTTAQSSNQEPSASS